MKQFVVGAVLDDLSFFHYDYPAAILYSAETMCHGNRGYFAEDIFQVGEEKGFGLGI